MHVFGMWMSYVSEVKGLSLDSMRDYLGIDKTNAHNALKDVEDCAQILIRFLKLHKKLSQKIKFKDSFKV
jgi:DNA polymerase III epsilon subunit-like protein